jgi:electron transport complex protein RnfD
MEFKKEGFILTSSPHIRRPVSTQKIMLLVTATLVPAIIFSILFFGTKVIALYASAIITCLVTEGVIEYIRKKNVKSLADGSAIVTAILLVMTLPPSVGWQQTAVGSFIAIAVAKELFGGLGQNIFNPALVGRAFLAAAYPVSITKFEAPAKVFKFLPDAVSSATPLAAAKFDKVFTPISNLFFGQVGGCIGETSSLALIFGGMILLLIGVTNYRLVFSYLGTVVLFTTIFWLKDPQTYANPLFHLFSGGLILGAFYMATDLVTSPTTNLGNIIFGVGAGVLVFLIRFFGGYPEGVMFSILFMNACTPLINRFTKTKVFGT